MRRFFALFAAIAMLGACTNSNDLDQAPADLGNFRLGHNVVVATSLVKGPLSRSASKDEWIASMKTAISERFDRYDGDAKYHFGVSVDGYVLAAPGIPIIASPKSVLIIKLTVWDDASRSKLNDAEQITVLESLSGETLFGSGLTQSREQQMQNLSRNAAKMIENYLKRHPEWFKP